MKLEFKSSEWNRPPPDCPRCAQLPMRQEFTPIAIGGSVHARAAAIAEDIAANDYNVANMHNDNREGSVPKVTYKDSKEPVTVAGKSAWGAHPEALLGAAAIGKQTRLKHGSSLDIIKTMPDYIANSKKLSAKVW